MPLREVREIFGDEGMYRLVADSVTVEEVFANDLRPGDRIVVPTDRGLMDRFGWNPSASDPVVDISLVHLGLPLDALAIRRLCGVALGGLIDVALGIASNDRDIDEAERFEAVSGILATLASVRVPPGWVEAEWTGFIANLQPSILEPRNEVRACLSIAQPTNP